MVKGKALYLQGNFEGAMVLYHRALHIGFASKVEEANVRQIIDRATVTINNSLGTQQASNVFLVMPKMLKKYGKNRSYYDTSRYEISKFYFAENYVFFRLG